MPVVDVLVPQMGEGLQEVLIVEFLKKPGERVERDEPFYSMETDKATLEVECPYEGVLTEWLAAEGDTLSIGAPICRMEVAEAVVTASVAPHGSAPEVVPLARPALTDLRSIPPRTRAFAKERGIGDETLVTIPAAGAKLMPEDIEAFLAASSASQGAALAYTERPVSAQDKIFIHRLRRSAEQVIPATAKRQLDWGPVRSYTDRKKAESPDNPPSAFNCLAFEIAQAVAEHPKFRSTLIREEVVREHRHVNLGVAVAVPTGELVVAVVEAADSLDFESFVAHSKAAIGRAREGHDQATESTQLLLTYMGPYEITDALPVLVAPAAAVLFIGSPFDQGGKSVVNLVLTFDHRLVHGVEAAEFLRTIARRVENLTAER